LGGLARRASFVEKEKSEGNAVLIVDSGRLFTDEKKDADTQLSLTKVRMISRAYTRMGVAAINMSAADLTLGLPFFRNEATQGFPLISANLMNPGGKSLIFSPYTIKKVGKVRIALFGLTSPAKNQTVIHPPENKFILGDPVKSARKIFRKLRQHADIIILLSDLDAKKEREVIKAVPGIHFVLGGQDGRYMHTPLWEGHTPILESYKNGMYAGMLRLTVVKTSSPFTYKGMEKTPRDAEESKGSNRFSWTLVPLHTSLPEDREISSWIQQSGLEKD
jgi:2',3'-cyclic-nucleotide 2'-phosphodiesterase (5'-nucleotidase family)